MITAERLQEIRHIAPTAGPLGQAVINELLAEVEQLMDEAPTRNWELNAGEIEEMAWQQRRPLG